MKRKFTIKLTHPIREMLAEIVLGLKDFELEEGSRSFILSNRKTGTASKKQNFIVRNMRCSFAKSFLWIQRMIGLINFRIVFEKKSDILFAHGGFLITNKPYVVYIEKATQLFGYTTKNYDTWLSKHLLRIFLRSAKLKKIIFLSEAAFAGMVHIESFDDELRALIRDKGTVVYPPISRKDEPSIERFNNINGEIRFLYISNNFYGKGGLEVLNAFTKLRKEGLNIHLVVITDLRSIEDLDHQRMLHSDSVELYDFVFTREELFEKFYNTCHVFCYPTYSDSFSSVINEALCSYLSIITTDFYAIPERVIDGYNGFVCKSPFRNYDKNFVIQSEHFTDQPHFYESIRSSRIQRKLQYVEEFLYDKMKQFVLHPSVLYQMAAKNKEIYEQKMNPVMIKDRVNNILFEAISQ